MRRRPERRETDLLRRSVLVGGTAALFMPSVARGQGRATVRIGVPTKTYFPTIIAETAIRQKLFEKEGINAELTSNLRQGFVMHALVPHHRSPGDHAHRIDFCQRRYQLIRHPIGEIVLCRISRQIL